MWWERSAARTHCVTQRMRSDCVALEIFGGEMCCVKFGWSPQREVLIYSLWNLKQDNGICNRECSTHLASCSGPLEMTPGCRSCGQSFLRVHQTQSPKVWGVSTSQLHDEVSQAALSMSRIPSQWRTQATLTGKGSQGSHLPESRSGRDGAAVALGGTRWQISNEGSSAERLRYLWSRNGSSRFPIFGVGGCS